MIDQHTLEVYKMIARMGEDFVVDSATRVNGALVLKYTASPVSRRLVRLCHGDKEAPDKEKIHCLHLIGMAVSRVLKEVDLVEIEDPEFSGEVQATLEVLVEETHSHQTKMTWAKNNLDRVAEQFDYSRDGFADFDELISKALVNYMELLLEDLSSFASDILLEAEVREELNPETTEQ